MLCTVPEFTAIRFGKKSHIATTQLKSNSQLKMRLHKEKNLPLITTFVVRNLHRTIL